MKRYGQACPLARALEVIGERWSLLVVRELLLGPRRYTDLAAALPGIGTNVLAARLRDLQEAGVVARRVLPPPASVGVYALTDAGLALRPAIRSLSEWGRSHGRPVASDDVVRPGSLLVQATGRGLPVEPAWECELRVDAESYRIRGGAEGVSVQAGEAEGPDAVVTLDTAALLALVVGRASPDETRRAAEVTGDEAAAGGLLAALAGGPGRPAAAG